MKKSNLIIMSIIGVFWLFNFNISFEKNKNRQDDCLKSEKKINLNSSNSNKYFKFLKKIKYLSTYQNVSLFQSLNNKNLLFNHANNNYVNVFNVTTKSSYSLVFSNDDFSINKNIENNYKYLIGTLNSRLDLKDTKNYNERIQNFDYQSDGSFKFNGFVVSNDNHSQRQFNGILKDKNLINFYVKYFDLNQAKWGFWKIFGIVVAVIAIVIMIAGGLYGIAGVFGALTEAGAEGGIAGAGGATASGWDSLIAGEELGSVTEGSTASNGGILNFDNFLSFYESNDLYEVVSSSQESL